jgi:crotonobetainyl-CoA:carnitine CoA-transferase CaiB-like acyl-CoA transferase
MLFNDLKVLELASVLAGPSVGQFFAELGAVVIKVENVNTGGDVTRTWKGSNENTDDRSAYFCSVNWGKKSMAVDLNSSEGKSVIQKLASRSDIVIASYKPGDAEKFGLSYEQLKTRNQQLIYGQITGYGSDTDRVGYDAVIQAESGFMDLNGEKNGEPLKMPVALVDVLAAHHLKEGLLVALLNRERNGVGSLVEVSLIQAAVSSLVNQASNWLVANKIPQRQGSLHPNIAPYGESFLTRDGKRLLLAIGNDRQFVDLLQLLKLHQFISDERFKYNQSRIANREALATILSEAIQEVDSNVLIHEINSKKIPAGIIQSVKDVFEQPQAQQLIVNTNGITGVRSFVATISGVSTLPKEILPPPHFGEHTAEIISSL